MPRLLALLLALGFTLAQTLDPRFVQGGSAWLAEGLEPTDPHVQGNGKPLPFPAFPILW